MNLTAVVPVHNNERQLPELIARLRKVKGLRCIFVEDCGKDSCREILRREADATISAMFMKTNVGQNRALLAGIQAAPDGTVVIMDGDLQDRPEAIPLLLPGLEEHDVIFAQRTGKYQSWKESLTSFFFKGVFRLASRFRLPQKVGTFFAMGPRGLAYFRKVRSRDPYIIGLVAMSGLRLSKVPVARDVRPGGGSSYNFRRRLSLALRAFISCGILPLPFLGSEPKVEAREVHGWLPGASDGLTV